MLPDSRSDTTMARECGLDAPEFVTPPTPELLLDRQTTLCLDTNHTNLPQDPSKGTERIKGTVRNSPEDEDGDEDDSQPTQAEQLASSRSLSERISTSVRSTMDKHYSNLFGDDYSKRQGTFVLVAGMLMAFNSGFINASCLSGLLTGGVKSNVAGYSAPYTVTSLALANGDWNDVSYPAGLVLSYILGTFVAGWFTPHAKTYRIEPTYGPTFMVGGVFLLVASILAALEGEPNYIFCLAAAANGIQNGIASIYSANLIRCSLTGASTDFALAMAQVLRGNSKNLTRGLVLGSLIINFWLGGIISFYLTERLSSRTLFLNAALFWLIGAALIVFLVHEIGISVKAAILGSWHWKHVLNKISDSDRFLGVACNPAEDPNQSALCDVFDEIDDNKDGVIDQDELLDALLKADVNVTPNMVKMLIQSADENNDGLISREEWDHMIKKMHTSSTKTKSSLASSSTRRCNFASA